MSTGKQLIFARYARYSTDKQRETSIEDQLRVCGRIIEREKGKEGPTFIDKAATAGSADRAGYQALREAARSKVFNAIAVEDLSRLWREQAEQWTCIKEWLDLGIHIITASGVDSRQHGFAVIASVQGAAAELARKETGYRVRRAKEGLAIKGKETGGRIYGYTITDGVRVINQKEARVVRRIFEMRRDGMSARAIALQLDKEGIPSPGANHNRRDTGPNKKPTDGLWRRSVIDNDWRKGQGLLNNERYAGWIVYGRTLWKRGEADSKKRWPVAVPPEQWIRHEVPEQRIVSPELWEAVQAIQSAPAAATGRGHRRVSAGTKRTGHWLSSVLVCAECNSNYTAYGRGRYICSGHVSGCCDNSLHFSREEAHGQMFDVLKTELLSPERIEQARRECEALIRQREEASRKTANGAVDTSAVDKQIALIRGMGLPAAAMTAALRELERDRSALLAVSSGRVQEQATRARAAIAALPDFGRNFEAAIKSALTAAPDAAKLARARELTRAVIKGGRVLLAPVASMDQVRGPVELLGLGAHVLPVHAAARVVRGSSMMSLRYAT